MTTISFSGAFEAVAVIVIVVAEYSTIVVVLLESVTTRCSFDGCLTKEPLLPQPIINSEVNSKQNTFKFIC